MRKNIIIKYENYNFYFKNRDIRYSYLSENNIIKDVRQRDDTLSTYQSNSETLIVK